MPLGDYLEGLAFFAGTWGAAGYVAVTVERRRLPRLDPAPRALALALLFLGALLAAHLIPGMLGVLKAWTVTLTAVLGAVATSRLPTAKAVGERAPTPRAAPSGAVSMALAAAAVGVVAVVALAALIKLRAEEPLHVDALSFALPGVGKWIRGDSLWDVGAFLGLIQVRTYPNNGELLDLAAILPWSNDAFLRPIGLPLLSMTGLGVYAIGRELRAPAATATLLAAAVVGSRVIALPTIQDIKPDVFMYATFAAGTVFLLRHLRTGARTDLLLAGLGLGLSFGARWYGLPMTAALVAGWAAFLLVRRRGWRPVLRDAALLSGVLLAAGGFWLLRNLALTGNPLYPVKVQALGVTIFDAPRDVITEKFGFTVADRFNQPSVLRHDIVPGLREAFGAPGLLALLGVPLAALVSRRSRTREPCPRLFALAAAAVVLALLYLFLPGGTQGFADRPLPGIARENARWLVPAYLLAVGAAAAAAGRLARGRLVVELLAFTAVVLAVPAGLSVRAAGVGAAVVALAVLALGVWLGRRMVRDWRVPRPRAVVLWGIGPVVALVIAGYAYQRHYNKTRYAGQSVIVGWIEKNAPSGHRVGVAGYWPVGFVPIYGSFGPRLRNDVGNVGPVVDGQLRFYHDGARFRRALRKGRYDLLVVGRLSAPNLEHPGPQRTLDEPAEVGWARPEGFVEVRRDATYVLLRRKPVQRSRVRSRRRGLRASAGAGSRRASRPTGRPSRRRSPRTRALSGRTGGPRSCRICSPAGSAAAPRR
jgi:hypothetical protein